MKIMESEDQKTLKKSTVDFAKEIEQRAKVAYTSVEGKKLQDFDLEMSKLMVERKKSEQDFRWQIVSFRQKLFRFLLFLMALETVSLFVLIILSSLPSKILVIADTTLQILVGVTLVQISAMIIVIIKSVYSDSLNQLIMAESQRHGNK